MRRTVTGFRAWLIQRVSAVYMLAVIVFALLHFLLDPPHSYDLAFEGQGGVAGFAKGGAHVALTPDDSGTLLAYAVKASVGGKLAQIGSRLIDGAAKKLAEQFFGAFGKRLSESDKAT